MQTSIFVILMAWLSIGLVSSTVEENLSYELTMNPDKTEISLSKVYTELTKPGSSSMQIVLIKAGVQKLCQQNKIEKYCADYNVYKKGEKGLQLVSSEQKVFSKEDWNKIRGVEGHLFLGGRPLSIKFNPSTKTTYIAQADIKKLLKAYKGFDFKIKEIKKTPPTTYVIPAPIWDFFNGENTCCPDCFAAHRMMGLPCSMDAICCFGACSTNTNCDGGGSDGGGDGGGGDDSGDDDSCSGESEVVEAPIEIGGNTCSYTGTVSSQRDDNGNCVLIPVSGVVTCGGRGDGIGGGANNPAQTQDVTGGY